MAIDKLSANAFATGAIANSLGYTPANLAGADFTGDLSVPNTRAYQVKDSGGTTRYAMYMSSGISPAAGNNLVIGNPLANSVLIFANNSTAVTVTASGNVGIGTTPASFKLEVKDTTNNPYINVIGNTTSDAGLLIGDTDAPAQFQIKYLNTYDALVFTGAAGASERMRINSNGQIGIGSASPSVKLEIDGSNYNTASNSSIRLTDHGNNTADGNVQASLIFKGRYWSGDDNTAVESRVCGLKGNSDGNTGSALGFFTQNNGQTGATEKVRISSTGYTYINTTSALAPDNAWLSIKSTESSSIPAVTILGSTGPWAMKIGTVDAGSTRYMIGFCNNGSATIGGITTNGSTTTYGTGSDYRLKKNVAPLTGALGIVAQLKPKTFTWKNTDIDSQGFIAHELQEILPGAVVGEKDAVEADGSIKAQMVDYSYLVTTLTAALQELKTEFDEYKASHP